MSYAAQRRSLASRLVGFGSRHSRVRALIAALLVIGIGPSLCEAREKSTWLGQAEAEMLCIGSASALERESLAAPVVRSPRDIKYITNFFRAPSSDARHLKFRHLTLLASIAWWADEINDQRLRGDTYAAMFALAHHYARDTGDAAFRQIAACAYARMIDVAVELGLPAAADRLASELVNLYTDRPATQSVEDWPLILGLRAIALEPQARTGIALITTRIVNDAGAALRTNQQDRATLLLSEAARGMLALGEQANARKLALQALTTSGRTPTQEAAWRTIAVLSRTTPDRNMASDAVKLKSLIQSKTPPDTLNDIHVEFEALLALARLAEAQQQYQEGTQYETHASSVMHDQSRFERLSMPMYRNAFEMRARMRSEDLGTLARHDPAWGAQTAATYSTLYEQTLRQAQRQFVAAARDRLILHDKVDRSLHSLASLYPAMPRSQGELVDTTFKLAQLRSFGRSTLAVLEAELNRTPIDPAARPHVQRFFWMVTRNASVLRGLLNALAVPPSGALPEGTALWNAFMLLDVFYTEANSAFDRYTKLLREKAPNVAELATPRPVSIAEFQNRLESDEALIVTLSTPLDLYVWSISRSGATLTRHAVGERELRKKVERLRAGLAPSSNPQTTPLPEFDAAVAHELYRLIFAPSAAGLKGITKVIWYGHGPLSGVPPAVLVSAPPPKGTLKSAAELNATQFLVDRYAFSVLADLSLFPSQRDRGLAAKAAPRFLGVGAPMLSYEELSRSSRAKSYDLAGSMEGRELTQLPKLAESADEMRAIARLIGESRSTLWLGPDASEARFTADNLRNYDIIALATHGFLANEIRNVNEPALMLTLNLDSQDRFEGILTSREIAALTLEADLVILSACNTAGADNIPRAEAFSGLAQAFFTAGARSLMASHWPVMSGAAVQLSIGTIERSREEHATLASSLQAAMQSVRKQGTASAIEAHPSYWGPFVIVGDGR